MANGLLEDVRKRVLPNGLTAVVHPDRSLPVVCLNVFVRVGSNCESDEVWGWSHGIEHMLFKGTARRKVGDIAREVQRLGGSLNAGTGYEFTNYHITLPSDGSPAPWTSMPTSSSTPHLTKMRWSGSGRS